MTTAPRTLLRNMFRAAVDAAQPAHCLPPYLPEPPRGRTLVIGAGKASAAMAATLEAHWSGPISGLVVTRYGYAVSCRHIEIVEAAHPVPDDNGRLAAERMLAMVQELSEEDLVICLMSGGGSSLLALPGEGVTLEQKKQINRELLRAGASIAEINCLRRHLSAIKGGRLAAACAPARVVNLVISDVPGDHLPDIASGPTVADPSTCLDALNVARRYQISLPPAAEARLLDGRAETVKADDPRMARVQTHLVATAQSALLAAADVAEQAGIRTLILGDSIEGEAREVGKVHAGIALQCRRYNQPLPAPGVILSGGETSVRVRGQGRGGRNVEFLLSLAIALDGAENIYALAADTDGVDGSEEIAGALLSPDSLQRAAEQSLKPSLMLMNNDGHSFFEALDDSLYTGPTMTNVNDFRALLIL